MTYGALPWQYMGPDLSAILVAFWLGVSVSGMI